jgi:hypothetical protein
VEGACFGVFRDRYEIVRMTLDWLDFSVEHMSKWWKVSEVDENEMAMQAAINAFSKYDQKSIVESEPLDFSMELAPTVALIAFQPYKGRELTKHSLPATLSSLVRVNVGRILIVGYEPGDEAIVQECFELFDPSYFTSIHKSFSSIKIHNSQVAYVRVTDDMVKSKFIPVNIPKASLVGLKHAMEGNDETWTKQWLGEDPLLWKYVYLTEPDTLLATRPSTLPALEQALRQGLILAPHRMQPIPYEGDFRGLNRSDLLVPESFKTPQWLDSFQGDACCDEQAYDFKPGATTYERCGRFWWECGFYNKGNHTRLQHYDFLRLKQGMGIVTLAGTEHGRRCFPNKQGFCDRVMGENHPNHPKQMSREEKERKT